MELTTTIKIGRGKARFSLDLNKPNVEHPLFMDWLAFISGTVIRIIAWKDGCGRIKPRGHAIQYLNMADYKENRPTRKVGVVFSLDDTRLMADADDAARSVLYKVWQNDNKR